MKRFLYILLLCICFTVEARPQGFDWQYSARMPTKSPIFFTGLSGDLSYFINNGIISFVQDEKPCESCFAAGYGTGFKIGVKAEYWKSPMLAIYGNISYNRYNLNMPWQDDFITKPTRDENGVETPIKYKYKNLGLNFTYVFLEGGYKFRPFSNSHLNVAAGLQLGVKLSSNTTIIQSVLNGDSTIDNILSGGRLNDFMPVVLFPQLKFGYDIPMGLGMYAAPTVGFNIPLISFLKQSNWKLWNFSGGITLYRGVF